MDGEERKVLSEYEKRKALQREKARKKQRRELIFKIVLGIFFVVIVAVTVVEVTRLVRSKKTEPVVEQVPAPILKKTVKIPPDYEVQLLDVNEYSRPGSKLEQVRGIVIHYTANPGTTAQQNRDYFEGLSLSKETYASSHFVIGIEGELIQCIPCSEISYASNERNADTIAIECCIPDESGKFSEQTYETLIHLTAWLMGRYDLEIDAVIRHYDVTGKNCPKYYVENEWAWEQLKQDVSAYINRYGTTETLETEGTEGIGYDRSTDKSD